MFKSFHHVLLFICLVAFSVNCKAIPSNFADSGYTYYKYVDTSGSNKQTIYSKCRIWRNTNSQTDSYGECWDFDAGCNLNPSAIYIYQRPSAPGPQIYVWAQRGNTFNANGYPGRKLALAYPTVIMTDSINGTYSGRIDSQWASDSVTIDQQFGGAFKVISVSQWASALNSAKTNTPAGTCKALLNWDF